MTGRDAIALEALQFVMPSFPQNVPLAIDRRHWHSALAAVLQFACGGSNGACFYEVHFLSLSLSVDLICNLKQGIFLNRKYTPED